ncbi:hypothetical protein [Peptostreptococcus faecalis]|uniref:hypothetical protein n=1 Tax=Peptostreptococcus faecalis TaxID=2045015 RepID=UPI000C798BDE|nr:hypothetical protein [Peptostreptococcus faecalis]
MKNDILFKKGFNKQDYLFPTSGRIKSSKNRINIYFIQDGNVRGRYKECLNNNRLVAHYVVDDTYCLRLLMEDCSTYHSWAKTNDVTIEVLNSKYGDKTQIERNLGSLLRTLYDKFGFHQGKVTYHGRLGNVNFNNVKIIANAKPYDITTNLITHSNNLKPLAEILKICKFKKVKHIERDGEKLNHDQVTDMCFYWDAYYVNHIGSNDKQSTLGYIRRFINSKAYSLSRLNKVKYVCYFNDADEPIARLLAFLAGASCFKDNGSTMEGSKIRQLKAKGWLIYISGIGSNQEDTARQYIQKYLV